MKDCDFTDEKPSKLMRVKPAGNQQQFASSSVDYKHYLKNKIIIHSDGIAICIGNKLSASVCFNKNKKFLN